MILVDGYNTLYADNATDQQPTVASGAAPSPYNGSLSDLAGTPLAPVTSSDPAASALVAATNNAIARLNAMNTDIAGGADLTAYRQDRRAFGDALFGVNGALQGAGLPSFGSSQADIDNALAGIGSSGLPSYMRDYLAASMSPGALDSLGNYVGGANVGLSHPTITLPESIDAGAHATIPEPSTLSLGLVALASFAYRRMRSR
jgi:hypothetical protein